MIGKFAPAASILACVLTLPLVAGYWGSAHPLLDELSSIRLHLAALIILLAIVPLLLRDWFRVALGLILAATMAIGSTFIDTSDTSMRFEETPAALKPGPRYSLLQISLDTDATSAKRLISLIGRTQADVIALNNVTPAWRADLALVEHAYPYQNICEETDAERATMLLSKRPFLQDELKRCISGIAAATISFGGIPADIVTFRLDLPWEKTFDTKKDRLVHILPNLSENVIAAGGFNTAWWSRTSRQLKAVGDLHGHGYGAATWLPRGTPDLLRRYLGLPLDDILVKGKIQPFALRRLESIGMGHLPLLMEFGISTEPATPPADAESNARQT